jgi:mono/diheme cytochrome c family protein
MRIIKKIFRYLGITTLLIITLLGCVVAYILLFLPNVGPAPDMKIELTPERIKKGKYLANHVMACMSCHSSRSWDHPGSPVKEGTLGRGGDKFTQDTLGFVGVLTFPNITPAALGSWTDGEIFRAITSGVHKDGKGLIPIMPYEIFGKADEEDIKSVIAYLRTLPPTPSPVPMQRDLPSFMNLVNNLAPAKPSLQAKPKVSDTIAYGRYLSNIAGCITCHSPFNGPLGVDMEKAFSGGPEFTMEAVHVTPINLTPDKETGIGLWSRENFLNKFRRYRDSSTLRKTINPKKDFTSLMPWASFAGMKDEDLSAIYSYLKSLTPKKNKIRQIITREELMQKQ